MESLWCNICKKLAETLPETQFKVWILPLSASMAGETLTIHAVNDFVAKFLRTKFLEQILSIAQQAGAGAIQVNISVGTEGRKASECVAEFSGATKVSPVGSIVDAAHADTSLNSPSHECVASDTHAATVTQNMAQGSMQVRQESLPLSWSPRTYNPRSWRYKFSDFVVGPCNELAHAAAKSLCAQSAHSTYSDVLFLCSQPGLGKTHLMQAVGSGLAAVSNYHAPRVEYLSAEEFATQMRLALRSGEIDRFKTRFREADVLLLEDIHFLQDKIKTQDEVLATVSSLLQRGSRVVFSSSFAPRDLSGIDSQLLSRLGSGLIAGIERPDFETRRKIISHKASVHKVYLADEVTDYLAQTINSDVRQIESCLHNLALKAKILNTTISMHMAMETVANYASDNSSVTLSTIARLVCESFGVTPEFMNSKSRKQQYVQARNTAFFLARKHTDLSLQDIGRHFNRSHSTVIKGITSLERDVHQQNTVGRQIQGTISLIERNANLS